jgi:hypothetical protein
VNKATWSALIIILSFFEFACPSAMASDLESQSAPTLEWQKLKLEEAVQARVSQLLERLIGSKEFIVRTEVISAKSEPGESRIMGSVQLGKLDIAAPAPASGDLAPLDLFSRLVRLNVTISVGKFILRSNEEPIRKVVAASLQALAHVPVAVSFEEMPVLKLPDSGDKLAGAQSEKDDAETSTAEADSEKPQEPVSVLAELLRHSLPISILLATFAISLLLFFLLKSYRFIESKKLSAIATANESKNASNPTSDSTSITRNAASDPIEAAAEAKAEGSNGQHNLDEQIRLVAVNYPQKVLTLIRKWLASDEIGSVEALCALPGILPMDVLYKLVDQLDEGSRRIWRNLLDDRMAAGFTTRARVTIFQELVTDLLSDVSGVTKEIRQILEGIKPDECAELAQKDSELGALLGHILSTPQTARMLALMPEDLAGTVALLSLQISPDNVNRLVPSLRRRLIEIRQNPTSQVLPFIDKAIDLIREVGPQREMILFSNFARTCKPDEVRKIFQQVCPADLITRAPTELHRQCLGELQLSQRAELIFGLPIKLKNILLNCYAPEEKVREILEAEFSQIELDIKRKQRTSRDNDKAWRAYVFSFRKMIHQSEAAATQMQHLVEDWISINSANDAAVKSDVDNAA